MFLGLRSPFLKPSKLRIQCIMKPRGEAQCANAPEQSKKAPFPFPGSSSFTFPNSPLRAPISWRKSSPIWGSVTSSPPMLICPASATTQISRCLRWVQKLLCICFPRSILFYSFYSTLPHFIPFHSTPLHSTPLPPRARTPKPHCSRRLWSRRRRRAGCGWGSRNPRPPG